MSLNDLQFKTIWAIVIVVAFMCLVPPWQFTFQRPGISSVEKPAGYGFVFSPPEPEKDNVLVGVVLDTDRLITQLFGVGILGGFIVFSLGKVNRGKSEKPHGPDGT